MSFRNYSQITPAAEIGGFEILTQLQCLHSTIVSSRNIPQYSLIISTKQLGLGNNESAVEINNLSKLSISNSSIAKYAYRNGHQLPDILKLIFACIRSILKHSAQVSKSNCQYFSFYFLIQQAFYFAFFPIFGADKVLFIF